MKKKVFVGLSGGVDSAVAALLLSQQEYDVTCVFMKNWSGEDYGVEDQCPWEDDLASAQSVAKHLNLPLLVYNFEKEYREAVVSDFFYQYSIGNTPNPDVLCNKYIKFSKFLERAKQEGADYIATGHYAKNIGDQMYRAKDKNKDQVYFLNQLSSEQISSSIFPLGDIIKPEVRKIAIEAGLPNANRKDSQGICFIGKIDVVDFLKNELKEKKGNIIEFESNKKIGKHNGIWFYTIGQRHGIGVGGSDLPYFVYRKDINTNTLYVVKGSDNPLLLSTKLMLSSFNRISMEKTENLTAQIRYRGNLYSIKNVEINDKEVTIEFNDPVWAPALGQSCVIYKNDLCIGGGVISKID